MPGTPTLPIGALAGMPHKARGRRIRPLMPATRSVRYLQGLGWACCVVEQWVRGRNITRDAFGFGDILACRQAKPLPGVVGSAWPDGTGHGCVLVQSTTADHVAARVTKILGLAAAAAWLAAGGRIVVHGWARRGPLKQWEVTEREVTREDFAHARERTGVAPARSGTVAGQQQA